MDSTSSSPGGKRESPPVTDRPRLRFWPHSSDPLVASTRIRCLQVIEGLRLAGRDAGLYVEHEPAPQVLVLGKRYDDASLNQALDLRRRHGTRLILDLCDNHFYAKDDAPRWRARAASLRRAAQEVDLVVASTPALAEVIHQETGGDRPIQVIGDPLDTALPVGGVTLQQRWHAWRLRRFLASRDIAPGRRLLWFGNHGASYADGGLQDLTRIERSLHAHHRTQALSLTVLSNSEDAFRRHLGHWTLPTLYVPWSPAVFRQALAGHAIAIIPAQINPFTRCKTPNRLATAFYNGLAVAADRIPSYEEFEDWAVLDDWDEGLGCLMADAGERARRVQAARQRLLQHHDLGTICRAWDAALAQLLHPAPTAQSVHST